MATRKQSTPSSAVPLSEIEQPFPSTTWAWKRIKVGRPAGGQQHSAAAGRSFWSLPRRNPRDPLAMTIKLRGGPECWVEVHARGSVLRCPGDVAVYDLLCHLNSQRP